MAVDVTLPSGLQTLTFGYGSEFAQSLEQVTLPSGLQTLMFGSGCDQSLEKATLPSGLQALMFGSVCDPAEWPSGLDVWLWQ